jgi:hypothetical protein
MIKHIQSLILFLFVFFISLQTQCISCDLSLGADGGLSFAITEQFSQCTSFVSCELNQNTINEPIGSLKAGIGYNVAHSAFGMGQGKTRVNLYYQKIPGLLKDWGHLGVSVHNQHPNIALNTCAKIVDYQINTMLDYNPEKNRQLEEMLQKKKAIIVLKEAIKRENDCKKIEQDTAHKEEEFLTTKKLADSYNKSDGQSVDVKEMLRQLQEKNGY